jgi:hypothetical protein
MRVSPRYAEFLPAVLLVLVACGQLVLARTGNLTPWKGGGFGMFSTLDHGAFRRVAIVVDAPDRSETIDVPDSLEETAARVVNFPSDWLIRKLAAGVVARERRYNRPVSRVTITVWRTAFNPVSLHAEERTLRTATFEARDLIAAPSAGGTAAYQLKLVVSLLYPRK